MLNFGRTPLFDKYVARENAAIYPWSLSIVDCYFIYNAFKLFSKCSKIELTRLWDDECSKDAVLIASAYDLYAVDTEAYGSEVVLLHEWSRSRCYWDKQERFVLALGSPEFLDTARPYPLDVEEHRFVESMEPSASFSNLYNDLRKR